jgi:AcrR family transcriptional regulator
LSEVHERSTAGLRERKKARTRAGIQSAALSLFEGQGYHTTTVDQIAAMAEVSPATFFRYFPTKEDVVLHDRYDPLLIADFLAQPSELSPISALRRTMRSVLGGLPADELARERQRAMLTISVPELRARALDQLASSLKPFADAVAERTGRTSDDSAVRALTGAVIGVSISAMLAAAGDPGADLLELIDDGLAHLEAGLDSLPPALPVPHRPRGRVPPRSPRTMGA